ncbi:MAG: hypothetical protein Roseis2KO_48930 [Roseivirga sp.]
MFAPKIKNRKYLVMKRFIVFTLLLSIFAGLKMEAQNPPSTDIYVFDLKEVKRRVKITKPWNISNREGYDNQPYFRNANEIFFTASQADGQTDIIHYNLVDSTAKNVTNTPKTSEYSAHMLSRSKSFVVVRVEEDGKQRLWQFPIDGKESPKLMFEELEPVGYHAWASTEVAMFILGDPNSLMLSSTKVRNDRKLEENIGRTLKTRGRNFLFSKKTEKGNQEIFMIAGRGDKVRRMTVTPRDANDWAVTPQGTYLASVGGKIWKINPEFDSAWSEILDLKDLGIENITRIAVSPDNTKLALVVDR